MTTTRPRTADKTNVTQEAGVSNAKPSAPTAPEDRYDSGICIDGVAFATTDVGPTDAGPIHFDSTKHRTELQRNLSAAEATSSASLTKDLAANCRPTDTGRIGPITKAGFAERKKNARLLAAQFRKNHPEHPSNAGRPIPSVSYIVMPPPGTTPSRFTPKSRKCIWPIFPAHVLKPSPSLTISISK